MAILELVNMQKRNDSKTALDFSDSPSLTEQHHADSVNIHNIVRQHAETGIITHINNKQPVYADLSSAPDFIAAQNIIANARSHFEEVPSQIRKQFDNDPAQFLEFISNPENKTALDELGLDSSHLPDLPEPQPTQAPEQAASATDEPIST